MIGDEQMKTSTPMLNPDRIGITLAPSGRCPPAGPAGDSGLVAGRDEGRRPVH